MLWKHLALMIHRYTLNLLSLIQFDNMKLFWLEPCAFLVHPRVPWHIMWFQAFLARGWLESGADTGSGRVAACCRGHLGTVGTVWQCAQELQSRVQRLEAKTVLENGEGIGNGQKYPRDLSRCIQISEWLPLGVGDIVCHALSLPGSWAVVASTGRIRNAKQKDNRKVWWIFRCAFQAKTEDAQ